MRLIDADAFAEFLKDAVKQQKYENTKIDRLLTVADVIEAVISELEGTSLVGFKNAPTIEPEPHWIPCSKRLPEDVEIGEEYPMVIFCTIDETYYGFLEYTEHGRTWWSGDAEYEVDEVVA